MISFVPQRACNLRTDTTLSLTTSLQAWSTDFISSSANLQSSDMILIVTPSRRQAYIYKKNNPGDHVVSADEFTITRTNQSYDKVIFDGSFPVEYIRRVVLPVSSADETTMTDPIDNILLEALKEFDRNRPILADIIDGRVVVRQAAKRKEFTVPGFEPVHCTGLELKWNNAMKKHKFDSAAYDAIVADHKKRQRIDTSKFIAEYFFGQLKLMTYNTNYDYNVDVNEDGECRLCMLANSNTDNRLKYFVDSPMKMPYPMWKDVKEKLQEMIDNNH